MSIDSLFVFNPVWRVAGHVIRLVLLRALVDPATARVSRSVATNSGFAFRPGTYLAETADLFATKAEAATERTRRMALTREPADRRRRLAGTSVALPVTL